MANAPDGAEAAELQIPPHLTPAAVRSRRPCVPLSQVIHSVVDTAYNELHALVERPQPTTNQRSEAIQQFLNVTEQRFKQLVVLARWSKQDIAKIDGAEMDIAETLDMDEFLNFQVRRGLHELHASE